MTERRAARPSAQPHDPLADIVVRIDDPRWQDLAPGLEKRLLPVIEAALSRGCALHPLTRGQVECAIVLADDATVCALNRTYRDRDRPSNVLSFAMTDGLEEPPFEAPLPLGDVILAFETVAGEAAEQGKPLGDHVIHLIVHGVLHLLGFDHQNDEDTAQMEGLEKDVLALFGIDDPYRDQAEGCRPRAES